MIYSRKPFAGRRGWKAALLAIAAIVATSWGTDYTAWSYYRTVGVTPTTTVTENVTNFPLLVCLTSANGATVFSASRSDGFDVRFTTADGTTDLPFQRESYNQATQTAKFWVRVPTVIANPTTTTVRMYWGNSAAADVQNAAATFSTTDGYRSVWHLTSASGAVDPDVTGSGHNLVPSATAPIDTTGPVGLSTAKRFNSSYYIANNSGGTSSTLNFPSGGPFTISAWVNPLTLQGGRTILGKVCVCNIATWIGSYTLAFNGSSPYQVRGSDMEEGTGFVRVHDTLAANSWTHLVWVRNGTGSTQANTNIYLNGVTSAQTTSPNTTSTTRVDTLQFCVGRDSPYHDTTVTYWNGCASEIEVYGGAWSPSRINLTYSTQLGTSTAVSFGADQSNGAFNPPILSSPANNAQGQLTAITFNWSTVNTATAYTMQLATVSTFATTIASKTGLAVPTTSVSGLATGATYYWQVQATKTGSASNWSSVWSFITLAPPQAPGLSSPANGSANVPAVTLAWNTAATAASYGVRVSTSSGFATTLLNQAGLAVTSAAFTGALGNTYYWQANATNGAGTSSWSNAWSFSVPSLPLAPALSAPSNGQAVSAPAGNLTLSWSTAAGALSYTLQVSTTSGFGTTVFASAVTGTSRVLSGIGTKMYYWRMQDSSMVGLSPWSTIWSFSVSSAVLPGKALASTASFTVKSSFIEYSIPAAGEVSISFMDIKGRTVFGLARAESAGMHRLTTDRLGLSPGRYIVTMKTASFEKKVPFTIAR